MSIQWRPSNKLVLRGLIGSLLGRAAASPLALTMRQFHTPKAPGANLMAQLVINNRGAEAGRALALATTREAKGQRLRTALRSMLNAETGSLFGNLQGAHIEGLLDKSTRAGNLRRLGTTVPDEALRTMALSGLFWREVGGARAAIRTHKRAGVLERLRKSISG